MTIDKKQIQERATAYMDIYDAILPIALDKELGKLILHEVARDLRAGNRTSERKERPVLKNPDAPATEKQIQLLERLNVAVPLSLTRGEASAMIDSARAR